MPWIYIYVNVSVRTDSHRVVPLPMRCIYISSIWRVTIRRWRPLLSAVHGKSKKKVVAYSSERRNRILLPSPPSHIFRITRGCMHANHFPSKQRCRTHYVPDIIVVDDVVDHLVHTLSSFAISLCARTLSLSGTVLYSHSSIHGWMDANAIRHSGEWVSSDSTIFSIQESSWRSTEMRCPAMFATHTILCAHTQFIHRGNFAIVIGMPFDPSFSVCMRDARIYYVCEANENTQHTHASARCSRSNRPPTKNAFAYVVLLRRRCCRVHGKI